MSSTSGELSVWLGLGNPGKRYETTRHNVGWQCSDALASYLNVTFQTTKVGQIAKSPELTLLKLPGYMNESGYHLKQALSYFHWSLEKVLVIHDDIDYPVGTVKLKPTGGDGGHRGVRSILEHFETDHFWRLRVGVRGTLPMFHNKAQKDQFVIDYVLSSFSPQETTKIQDVFQKVFSELPEICRQPKHAMNAINRVSTSNP